MSNEDLLALLSRARAVLDRHMFDAEDAIRDDVAEVCMAIDDALPDASRIPIKKTELELNRQKSAA
jgi:hypothetical protein